MQFVYKPEGVEPKRWDFDPDKLMSPEAEAIERLTKMTYGEWKEAVQRESITALHGLLYVMLKRTNPTLKWDEVQFSTSELDFELDDEETARLVAVLKAQDAAGGLSPQEAELLASLTAQAEPVDDEPGSETTESDIGAEVPKED